MADVSHRGGISDHPDAKEMQQRYTRVLRGRGSTFIDGPIFLVGLYLAVSPWVIDYFTTQNALATHSLIVGLAIAVLALGFAARPERMAGLSLAVSVLGAWTVVATWVVGDGPDAGLIVSNCIVGGLAFLLGLMGAGVAMNERKKGATASR